MANRTGTDSVSAGMRAVAPVRWLSIAIAVQVCGHTVTVCPPASTLCSRPRLKPRSAANRASELSGFHCCGSHPGIRHPGCAVQANDFRLPMSQKPFTPLAPYRFVVWRTRVHGPLPVNSFDHCSAYCHHHSGGSMCLVKVHLPAANEWP